MRKVDFDALIVEGFDLLPEWVRSKISNVALLVEDQPSKADRKAEGLSERETLLGLYKGIPLTARGDFYGVGMTLPDTITLYRLPILEAANHEVPENAPDEVYFACVRDIVRDTVWHEFAHHFGMNEHEVRSREKEKGIEY